MSTPQTDVREFRQTDLGPAFQLSAAEGWNQTLHDWARIVGHQPGGCFVAIRDGRLAGTVTTTRYGCELAWIGMMIVAPDCRRSGLATVLMNTAVSCLRQAGVDCIKLDATPAGEAVYRKLGFVTEWTFQRWVRPGESPAGALIPDCPTLIVEDPTIFGADRSRWLKLLARDSVVTTLPGGLGMLRGGRRSDYLGPVSADNPMVASEIVDSLLEQTEAPVYWDIPGPNKRAMQLAIARGFEPGRDLTRMRLGPDTHRPDLSRQFAIADPGVG